MITQILFVIAVVFGIHITATWVAAIRRSITARRRLLVKMRQPRRWPFVSVIVPAWNERGTIEGCIHTLRSVEYASWEAIVVAGGSDDTYRAAIESCKDLEHVRVLEQQPRGKNAALNQGLRVASGEVIVVLDADSQVPPEWLRSLVAPISSGALATTGRPAPLRRTWITRSEQMEQIAAWDIRNAVTLQGSGSIAIHRTVIEQIGGFPEDVPVGVDWDLDARLAVLRIARVFCAQAHVYTQRPATLSEYWRNEVRWRRAHLASLFRLRSHFLRDLPSAIQSLYVYVLAWVSVILTLGAIIAILLGSPHIRALSMMLWVLFIAWLMLRRATLAIEVAVYTRQTHWLRQIWVPPLLLFFTFVAGCIASMSIGRSTIHFKGPRRLIEKSQ
jgi:cellulose synthase/poly-beta-1,6-N-acetylglucosamine synthase-like glycosyltransferase